MDSAFNKDVVLINTDAVPSKRLVSFMKSQFHLTHLNFNFFMEATKPVFILIREKHMIQPCIVNNTEWKLGLDNFCQNLNFIELLFADLCPNWAFEQGL